MTPEPFFIIRPGRSTDHALILESWTTTHAGTTNGKDHGIDYFTGQKDLIRSILARASTTTRVAADPEDEDAVFGYAVLGHLQDLIPRIYYAYVKSDGRNVGVATALLKDLMARQITYTHRPPHYIEKLLPSKPQNWVYSYFQNFKD